MSWKRFAFAATLIAMGDAFEATGRITGGQEADIRDYPYQVMVLCSEGSLMGVCGGALVHDDVILTAAHCVADCNPDDLSIIAGVNKYDAGRKRSVDSVIVHPKFRSDHVSNDIAVVFLKQKLKTSDRIAPARITERQYPAGTDAVVTGWGITDDDVVSRALRFAKVKLIGDRDCRTYNFLVDRTQICSEPSPQGPCKGDSGGPLVADGKLIGLVSYGGEDCDDGFVRVYSNVYHFRKFIFSAVRTRKRKRFNRFNCHDLSNEEC